MTLPTWIRAAAILAVIAVFSVLGYRLAPRRDAVPPLVEPRPPAKTALPRVPAAPSTDQPPAPRSSLAVSSTAVPTVESAQPSPEKATRVDQIRRDYDDVRAKAAAEYAATGRDFPGGLNGFLRQLTLLERERRADLAAVLTPRELEDLELQDSTTGQTVARLLKDAAVTDEQRRAVFRLQREFDDRFALAFDLTPAALLERENARLELNLKIRSILGDTTFFAWLQAGELSDYAPMAALVKRQGLPAETSIDLWRVKSDFTIKQLEINSAAALSATQRKAALGTLIQQTELRLIGILGAGSVQLERDAALQWLPKP